VERSAAWSSRAGKQGKSAASRDATRLSKSGGLAAAPGVAAMRSGALHHCPAFLFLFHHRCPCSSCTCLCHSRAITQRLSWRRRPKPQRTNETWGWNSSGHCFYILKPTECTKSSVAASLYAYKDILGGLACPKWAVKLCVMIAASFWGWLTPRHHGNGLLCPPRACSMYVCRIIWYLWCHSNFSVG
jgi:hypothetical protein